MKKAKSVSLKVGALLVVGVTAANIYGLYFDNSFLSVFNKKRAGFYVVSKEVEARLMPCCEKRDAAIELLKNNGFKVKIISDPQPDKLAQSIKQSKIDHDGLVVGERGPGVVAFWRVLTQYKITLYTKDNKVAGVYATVDTTYP